ncbi:MAG: efflux RND transporter periplasmic adaptor subunit [Nitrosomonadales bacterium]|nr:MAG: efflux RND transporter periplasmic adaptor subunit [Nitrosomonadales bacterium]
MKHIFLPALAAIFLAACDKSTPPPLPPPVVKTLTVSQSSADAGRAHSGEIRARYETPLAFRIGGKMLERRVDTGAAVKTGQLLARLDPADVRLAVDQAEAQRALALAEAKRYRNLHARNFVSAAALDARETTLATAKAQAAMARNQAAYADLNADHDGVVAAVLAEPGQVVSAGQPVLRIARDGEREAAIAVPEAAVTGLKPGMAAEISLWSGGQTYQGRLREISPAADPATRTYAARVSILDADAGLALGMTASVRFATRSSPAPVVPLAALFQQGQGFAVWAVGSDSTVSLKPVTVAGYTDAGARIAAGLQPGDRIVAAGVHKLTAGQKVRIAP